MSDPINHHYLPVFYLRQWCDADGKVVRYYRPHKEVLSSPITPKYTGYEPFLYSLAGYPPEHRQVIETNFMAPHVDGPASEALAALMSRQSFPDLSVKTRHDWTRFLMAMALRDPATMAKIKADARRGLEARLLDDPEEYEEAKGDSPHPTLLAWAQAHTPALLENIGVLYLPDLIENEQIGTVIIRMRWATLDLSRSAHTLLTSDRPYIRTSGLKDPECVIVLPLSPHLAFVATHGPEQQRRLLRLGTMHLVKCINAHVVAQAVKHVYGDSDRHQQFVENRLCPPGHLGFASPLHGLPGAY